MEYIHNHLDLSMRGAILALRRDGRTLEYIRIFTGVSISTIQSFLTIHHDDPIDDINLADRQRSGCPRATSSRTDRLIIRNLKTNRFISPHEMTQNLRDTNLIDLSDRTIKNRAEEIGLHHRIRRKRPELSKQQIQDRLKWAIDHQGWTMEDWKKVLWTDESKVCALTNSARQYVWRFEGEEYE